MHRSHTWAAWWLVLKEDNGVLLLPAIGGAPLAEAVEGLC